MTTEIDTTGAEQCPAQGLLKTLSGKWKPEIFRLATEGPLRFNALLRRLPGSSRQSLAVALREMEESGLLTKTLVRQKPLHIEYALSARGASLVAVFRTLENLL
ncbi:MAG: helix-turn-helix transcriptional regulator [Saprospiraceae bacterium]|nr:helix-turn-helix transcriptional regulator [Saprospiraceae bacterium]